MAGIKHRPVGDELYQTEFEATDSHDLSELVVGDLPIFQPAIANGTANYLWGMNAAANAKEWKNLVGTSNRVTVTHSAGGITLSGPQDLHTAATPTFELLILGTNQGQYSASQVRLEGHANHPDLSGEMLVYSSRGTKASPTAVQANDQFLRLSAIAYGATGYSASRRGVIGLFAEENWTDSAQGCYWTFATTAPGGTTRTEKMRLTGAGYLGLGTGSPTAMLDLASDVLRLRTAKTPASAGAAGNAGDICWDSSYIYVAVATNTWKRAALSTW